MPEQHVITQEIWKPIPSTGGRYEASNHGRIRATQKLLFWGDTLHMTTPPRILKIQYNRITGYGHVGLFGERGSKPRTATIHCLVAEAFHGPRPREHDINHKNGKKRDNRPENLDYVTRSENIIHSFRVVGRKVQRTGNRRITPAPIVENLINRFKQGGITKAQLSREFGLGYSTVIEILRGKRRRPYLP